MLKMTITGRGLPLLAEVAEALGSEAKARRAYRRALNEAGRDTRAPIYRALAKQTGLKISVARRAVKPVKASAGNLEFIFRGGGGFINLGHFAARETRKGLSAAPRGKRSIFPSVFTKGGRFPNRKSLPYNGGSLRPYKMTMSSGGWSMSKGKIWGRPFTGADSDVRIPDEMVRGITAQVFESVGMGHLEAKVARHIGLVSGGVLT